MRSYARLVVVVLGMLVTLTAGPALAQAGDPAWCYASDLEKRLWKMEVPSGLSTLVGEIGIHVMDIAISPSGELFGSTGYRLVSIDPVTGAGTEGGHHGSIPGFVVGLDFAPDGTLYGATQGSGALVSIDTTTGAATVLHVIPYSCIGDVAVATDGTVYGSFYSANLIRIDPVTGATTNIGPMRQSAAQDFEPITNTFYGTSGLALFEIDPSTAATTDTGTIPVAFGGLTFPFPPSNEAPTANAGTDQPGHPGDLVSLDGSGSFDDNTPSEHLIYAWSFVERPAGSSASLVSPASPLPTFLPDLLGDYVIQLIVTDEEGLSSDPDSVIITSNNCPPTAVAALFDPGQRTFVGDTIFLDGTGSNDPDNDPLTFCWTMISKPEGSLVDLTCAGQTLPSFVPDVTGVYEVQLVVNDGHVDSDPSVVSIVASTPQDVVCNVASAVLSTLAAMDLGNFTTKGNKTALEQFLKQACKAAQRGDFDMAIRKLQDVQERSDGCFLREAPDPGSPIPGQPPAKDYILDCPAQLTIYGLVQDAVDLLAG